MTSLATVRASRVALLVCALLAGCGFPVEHDATPLPTDELPPGLRRSAAVATTVPVESELVTVWFISDRELVAVRHPVGAPVAIDPVMTDLLAGPSPDEQERGLRTAVPDPSALVSVTLARGLATVTLSPAFLSIAAEDQLLAVGQFVMTLTDFPGVGGVQFLFEGQPIAVPLPTGDTTNQPVYREEYELLRRP